jgi:O-methyltransferase involved in polyketide biosynthesis
MSAQDDGTGWNKPDVTRPNIARVYDYWLGGKDNFQADRDEAERLMAIYPALPLRARENRIFLARAVGHLAAQGIRQFLDIGAGLPTAHNTHQIAQDVDPACRVVYADNDPVVLSHARALLAGDGVVAAEGDLTRPAAILRHPDVAPLLKPDEPLAVIMACVLHFVDAETARRITSTFAAVLAPGSCLAVSAGSGDEETIGRLAREYQAGTAYNHSPETIASFFTGWELQPPGLVDARDWKPEGTVKPKEHRGGRVLAGVGRKDG